MSGRSVSHVGYDDLPAEVAAEVRDASTRIRVRMQRTAADIVEIGRDLIVIKSKVGHGNFLPWIEQEFGMSEDTAQNFMRVAKRFGDQMPNYSVFEPTVLYELAKPSTPAEVRDNVVEMAQRGEKVTTKTVAELKEKLKKAAEDLKAEKETRAAIEGRSREVMAERDDAQTTAIYLRAQNEQLQKRLQEAESASAASAVEPSKPEPQILPPEPVDVNLMSMLALWEQSAPATRQAFLEEIRAT
jgi:hypothetical protein